jgi:glycosyltransferase involved in cell wall biosynthesis
VGVRLLPRSDIQVTVRVLILTSADETIGGVPYVIGNLARHLQKRGHEVIFLYSGTTLCIRNKTTQWGFRGFDLNLQVPFGDRLPIVSLLLFLLRFPIGLLQLVRLIRKHRIQIVNVHYPAECFFYFALCRRLLPITLVTSVHGADLFPGGRARATYPKTIKLLLRSSDRIVAPSNAYREDVGSVFPQLRDKIVCIHNGVDLTELESLACHSARTDRSPYILCVAMHNEKKGIDVLLRAFAQIQDKEPKLRLMLAGDGPLRSRFEELAASLGIVDKVKFLGQQGRAQVADLLYGCEVFVLPSRSEPFGIVLIEAMAFKKPVVATTVGGIPEIIENGKDGILVEPDNPRALAEALITVLEDRTLSLDLAKNGYVKVHEEFRCEKTGSAYEAIFADLLRVNRAKAASAIES